MHAPWSPYSFGILALFGLSLLAKSVAKLIAIYTAGPQLAWAAKSPLFDFDLKEGGIYEISVKRTSIVGVIPKINSFQVSNRQNGESVTVDHYNFLLSKRTDMAGNRIVPIAELTISQPGSFRLLNPATDRFTETDKLVLQPKAEFKGILMIIATVFSSLTFIGGLVLFSLSLIKK